MNKNFLLHFRPRRVPAEALRFSLTWGLGGMAALMIAQQLLSGLLLTVFYEPQPVQAYLSVVHIRDQVFLGRLLRNLHHWSGHALVVVALLHLLRVFVARAFYPPRHRNWLVGLGLGLLLLVANFSGYLLPWDQLSYWAVTIATSMLSYIPFFGNTLQEMMRGGSEVGGSTLHLFFAIHTSFVPLGLLLLMAYHFWFVRKAGGVLLPDNEGREEGKKRETVSAVPELLGRELAFAALVSCVLLLFGMAVDAPLGTMANPELTPPEVKAPWYFLGAQELLLHVPPIFAVFFLPLGVSLFLVLLPFTGKKAGKPGSLVTTLFFTGLVLFVGLTVTGIWFRGPGMQWVVPW